MPALPARGLQRAVTIPTSYGRGYLDAIVGAPHCAQRPRTCHLGVITDDAAGRVTIHLSHRDPDLLNELTLPFASPAPAGTPLSAVHAHAYPGTGPYRFLNAGAASVDLTRNPFFHPWSVAAQPPGYPDRIRLQTGTSSSIAAQAMLRRKVDVVPLGGSAADAQLATAFRREHPQLVHATAAPQMQYVLLNLSRPPFRDVTARRALSTALDRAYIAKLLGNQAPACGFVPTNFPGYSSHCPYPTKGNLQRAKAILRHARPYHRVVQIVFLAAPPFRQLGAYVYRTVRALGYQATYRPLPDAQFFSPTANPANRRDVTGGNWFPDFPAASNYYLPLLSCAALATGGSVTSACDRHLDAQAARARNEQLIDPGAAEKAWQDLYATVSTLALAVPTNTGANATLISPRLGNFQTHEIDNELLDQMWVR